MGRCPQLSVKSYGTHALGSATSPYAANRPKNAPSTAGLAGRRDWPFGLTALSSPHVPLGSRIRSAPAGFIEPCLPSTAYASGEGHGVVRLRGPPSLDPAASATRFCVRQFQGSSWSSRLAG